MNDLLIKLLVAIARPDIDPNNVFVRGDSAVVYTFGEDGEIETLGYVEELIEAARKQSLELRKLKQLSEHDF